MTGVQTCALPILIPITSEKAGYFCGDEPQVAPVMQDGACFYVNKKGRKKIVPDKEYEELGVLSENRIAVKKDGKAGYVDEAMMHNLFAVIGIDGGYCHIKQAGTRSQQHGDDPAFVF